jgi:ATP-binding cassette subfamily B protein
VRHLKLLLPYLKPYRRALLAGLVWLAVTNLLGLLVPWLLKMGIDGVQGGAARLLSGIGAALAGVALVRYVTRNRSRHAFLRTACRIEIDLRDRLLKRLLEQGGPFFDRHRTGDLLSRFTNDVANLRILSGFGLMIMLNSVLVYAFTLVVLLRLSPRLTLAALLPCPLLLIGVRCLSVRLLAASGRVQRGLGRVSEALEEAVAGQAEIRGNGLYAVRCRHFKKLNDNYLADSLVVARLRSAIGPIMALIVPLGTLLVFYLGGRQAAAGRLSLGELVAINAYVMQLAMPTLMLGWVLGLTQRGAASAERLGAILALEAARPGQAVVAAAAARPPAVSLKNLTFAYQREPALRDLHLEVPAGSLVGITGTTGSGKSTLLRLLAGLYPVAADTIFVAGQDLASLDGSAHRRRLAMVPQEGRLFSGSVRDNVLYALPDGDEQRLRQVLAEVCLADEVAAFAQGADTQVGEGGKALSGGQRQRVCLGRALARGGALWLLDDPFSQLDAGTAQAVWKNLRARLAGSTVFLVSARVSLLADADLILVLDRGRPVAQGSHGELLAAGGLYARLVERERLRRELEAAT